MSNVVGSFVRGPRLRPQVAHIPRASADSSLHPRSFASSTFLLKRQDDSSGSTSSSGFNAGLKRKTKKNNPKTSLRQVAVEAERSRAGIVKTQGNRKFIDPDADFRVLQ